MSRMTHEMRAQLDAFKSVRVKHPRLEEVDRAVTQAIHERASYAHLILYGPSGVGKSMVDQAWSYMATLRLRSRACPRKGLDLLQEMGKLERSGI
jgi:replication-associated recombination protein RarA